MYTDTIKKLEQEIPTMIHPIVSDILWTSSLSSRSFNVEFDIMNNGQETRLDDILVIDTDTEEEFSFMTARANSFPQNIAIALLHQANLIHKAKDLGLEIAEEEVYWNDENKSNVNKYGA